MSIENLGGEWPWPKVSNDRTKWFETNLERYDYSLEVLPPIYFPGGFFVSEPAAHDERDVPIYAAFVNIGSRYFVREVAQDKIKEAVKELHESLSQEVKS